MIKSENGRTWTERTPEEDIELLKKDLARLSVSEREVLATLLGELDETQVQVSDKPKLIDVLSKAEYKEAPVDIETFIKDPYYLGTTCDNIYPKYMDNLKDLFSGGYHEVVLTGAIGIGKTFIASIGICRILYELSLLADPHASLGLAKDTNISIVALSVNENLATKVVFENLVTKLKGSPYFQEKFPFEATKKELRFPNHIWIAPRATTDTSALGLNVVAALLDETNFIPSKKSVGGDVSRADVIYNSIKRRIKSRFERQGKVPGMIFICSSKQTSDDFTAKLVKDAMTDPTIFVIDYPLWGVKPDHYFSKEKFTVLCGTDSLSSRILTPEEAVEMRAKGIPEGAVLLEVPEDFRRDFERDLENSIRDIGGVATASMHPFIQRREKIRDCIDPQRRHPCAHELYEIGKPVTFNWPAMVCMRRERSPGSVSFDTLRPIINPNAARHIHLDLALGRKDAAGLCMSHLKGWKEVIRRSEDGREYPEIAPIYYVDLILKIVPPTGGEIILSEIRHVVYDLSEHGYTITNISLDQYQSADSIQTFNQKGFKSERISVDTTPEPYDTLKLAFYEDRIEMYEYMPLYQELIKLREVFANGRRKIDHPPDSSKDIADALAGSIFTLSRLKATEPLPIMSGISYSSDAWMEEQRQIASPITGAQPIGAGMLLPPMLGGWTGEEEDPWKSPWRP